MKKKLLSLGEIGRKVKIKEKRMDRHKGTERIH